jgi:hypothetical protein
MVGCRSNLAVELNGFSLNGSASFAYPGQQVLLNTSANLAGPKSVHPYQMRVSADAQHYYKHSYKKEVFLLSALHLERFELRNIRKGDEAGGGYEEGIAREGAAF